MDELLLDPGSAKITHFILDMEYKSGKKEVVIPLSYIDRYYQNTVYLKFSKADVNRLPSIDVNRAWKDIHFTDIQLMVWMFDNLEGGEEALGELKNQPKEIKNTVLYGASDHKR